MKNNIYLVVATVSVFLLSCQKEIKVNMLDENGDKIDIIDENDVSDFESLITEDMYDRLFPKRYGYDLLTETFDENNDFFSYRSLVDAVKEISNIKVEIYQRYNGGTSYVEYAQKVVWTNKLTGDTREMITHEDYNASWNISKEEHLISKIDYADFCNIGSLEERKRELAAFFANISHETTGGGYAEKTKTWGLYWREEVAWQLNPNTPPNYFQEHSVYPPTAGKSYHGRGPIQLSWNYNYGQVSEYLYGDKTILLDNPEKVLESGKNAFITGIWFWMTPQSPKPSCHQVMLGEWVPTTQDINAKRDQSKFGMTINIINGGLECGASWDGRALDRVEFYDRYLEIFGIDRGEDICSCQMMVSY